MTDIVPARAIKWVTAVVPGARAVRVLEQFVGATTSSLHAIEVDRDGAPPLALVLRRYTDARVRETEPQSPRVEAGAFRVLEDARDVIAPFLIAVDPTGEVCDVPAVLMSRLDGRPDLAPVDVGQWVSGLAQTLATIHRLDGADIEGVYERWHNPQTVQPPQWSQQPGTWARLIEASRDHEPAGEIVLLHRDYHPGNVLWRDGVVTGVVDWPDVCRGVAGLDVGHCRRDIVMTHDIEVAEAFLAAYREASGRRLDPLCDVLTLLDINQATNVAPYHAYGRTDLTLDLVHSRLDKYAALVASRL